MSFSIGFLDDGRVLEYATTDSAVTTERNDYTLQFYIAARDPNADIDFTVRVESDRNQTRTRRDERT